MSSLGAVINRHSCWVPHLTDYHPQSPSQPIQHSLRNPDAISSNNITPFASNRFKYTEADRRLDSIGDTTDGKNFVVLNEADVRQRLQDDSSTVSTNLSISGAAAIILLRHYHWIVTDVHEAWFADEDKVRKTVGLLKQQVVETLKDDGLTCGICFESYPLDGISTAACGHPFCSTCWKSYMRTSIDDGPGCLMLRCPHLGCHAAVDQDMISVLASDDDQRKYARHLLRSYIEDNLEIKWCPAEGCEYAVEFVGGSGGYDVACLCSHRFCWNCTEEAHHPVDCGTVAKWIRNTVESLMTRLGEQQDYMKPLNVTGRRSHSWLCLVAWTGHTNSACERVEAAKQEANDETERTREMAKNSLEKYTHYYKRWATNESLRQKALHDLHQMQNVQLEKLTDRQSQTKSQLKFIIEAWLQIVECRRVLKWTYVYGYYLPEDELAKKQLFEYLQGEAEAGLEKLHECAKDLQKYLTSETPNDFNDFQKRLAGLTSVTGNYFENLVRALEDGLSEVKGKSGRGKAASKTRRLKRNSDNSGSWYCDKCTYRNSRASTRCAICATMANEINKSPSN